MERQGSAAKFGLDLNGLKRRIMMDLTLALPIQITMPTLLPAEVGECGSQHDTGPILAAALKDQQGGSCKMRAGDHMKEEWHVSEGTSSSVNTR